ncbi:MAG: Magnesium chelatase, subunit ChlI [Candidatus Syntrophoarchaeum sp. GoM_oil]|nr:MAG: Magnesium chelatase, subunit ChlI [Candidatus Syntrophoarchaeum sp. GoM_oil]
MKSFDPSSYKPVPVKYELRDAILGCIRDGVDPLRDIGGRGEAKSDVLRALLSGSNPFLISREGTGKTRLAKSIAKLLPEVPSIKGCPYHDDPLWPTEWLCPRCRWAENPIDDFGVEFIRGVDRFSRIQGNEYTNYAKILGLKDIEAIRDGISLTDPRSFTGTGVFHGNRGIVFVDELPSIPTNVQVLFHPILEEGVVILDEYNLRHPIDIILIATGNPEGFSHVNRVPKPLIDRLEMIHLGMPHEEVERSIIMQERFDLTDDYFMNEGAMAEAINPASSFEFDRSSMVVPWWIVDLVAKTLSYTRRCKNFEGGASIRGGIKALDHAISGAEMRGAGVVTLSDACKGLRLALRGRTTVIPDLTGFDEDEEKIFNNVDRVIEDLVRFALKSVAEDVFTTLALDPEQLQGVVGGRNLHAKFPEKLESLHRGIGKADVGSADWIYASMELLVNIAVLNGFVSKNEISDGFFVPRVFSDA